LGPIVGPGERPEVQDQFRAGTIRPAGGRDWPRERDRFIEETDRILDLLAGVLPEVRALDDAGTLTFLHGTISTSRHPVAVPAVPMYLDGVLVDTPLTGGLEFGPSAHGDRARLSGHDPARPAGCPQPPRLRLSLGHAVPAA
jgi:hypothetical protein